VSPALPSPYTQLTVEYRAYEKKHQEVLKTKSSYDEACRNADASEDELKFNGNGATATPSPISRDDVSEDGVDEDDETLVGRSGGTGSLSAALGRAFSVRRKNDAGVVEVVEPNVGAALDWSKSTWVPFLPWNLVLVLT
jgi:hypothetical protein